MCSINNTEEFYKTAARSVSLDIKNMTAEQIADWKAALKANEADYLIHAAFNHPKVDKKDMGNVAEVLAKQTKEPPIY